MIGDIIIIGIIRYNTTSVVINLQVMSHYRQAVNDTNRLEI